MVKKSRIRAALCGIYHPRLSRIPAPVGSQEVMPLSRGFPTSDNRYAQVG